MGDEAAQGIADAAIGSASSAVTSAWPLFVSPTDRAADHAQLFMRRVDELPADVREFYLAPPRPRLQGLRGPGRGPPRPGGVRH